MSRGGLLLRCVRRRARSWPTCRWRAPERRGSRPARARSACDEPASAGEAGAPRGRRRALPAAAAPARHRHRRGARRRPRRSRSPTCASPSGATGHHQGRPAPVLRRRGPRAAAPPAGPRDGDEALPERRGRPVLLHEARARAAAGLDRDLRHRRTAPATSSTSRWSRTCLRCSGWSTSAASTSTSGTRAATTWTAPTTSTSTSTRSRAAGFDAGARDGAGRARGARRARDAAPTRRRPARAASTSTCRSCAGPTQKEVWTLRQGARAGARRRAPGADHRRVPHREAARGPRAGGLQPERLGPHPGLRLLGAAAAARAPSPRRSRGRRSRPASRSRTSAWTTCRAASPARGDLFGAAARRADRAASASERPLLVSLPLAPPYAPMEARLVDEIPDGRRLAVRAQVGRLPLPRLPRRRPGRAPVEGRPAAGPLLPGGGRGLRALPARSLRPRRGDRDPGGRPPVLRRAAPAHPPRGEPDRAAAAETPAVVHRLRPAGGRRRARRWSSSRSLERRRRLEALRGQAPRAVATTSGSRRRHGRRGEGARLARHGGAGAGRRRWPSGWICPTSRRADRHGEGEAHAHRRLRGGRLPLRSRPRVVGSLLLGLYDDGRAAPPRRLHVRLPAADRKALAAPSSSR